MKLVGPGKEQYKNDNHDWIRDDALMKIQLVKRTVRVSGDSESTAYGTLEYF